MFNMERQLPYAINYKTLKRSRTVENLFLWSVFTTDYYSIFYR